MVLLSQHTHLQDGYHIQFRFVISGIANTQTRFVSGTGVVDGGIDDVNSSTDIKHHINYYSTSYVHLTSVVMLLVLQVHQVVLLIIQVH